METCANRDGGNSCLAILKKSEIKGRVKKRNRVVFKIPLNGLIKWYD
jgi:hypothetical protein